MYCKKCGKEINEDAVVCIHCGCQVENAKQNNDYEVPKYGLGFVMAFFLGVVGLIIGICLYPSGTYARETFIKSWSITFGISIGAMIIISLIISLAVSSSVSSMYQ